MSLPKTTFDLQNQGWEKQSDGSYAKTKTNRAFVGQLPHTEPQHSEIQALAGRSPPKTGCRKAMGRVCVQIISLRKRLIDDDNLIGGAKPLRDQIAKSLGLDDGDPRLVFEYSQIKMRANCGTHIIIR
jgi:hypothetical protein